VRVCGICLCCREHKALAAGGACKAHAGGGRKQAPHK
jgi:hypothetical protein